MLPVAVILSIWWLLVGVVVVLLNLQLAGLQAAVAAQADFLKALCLSLQAHKLSP